MKPLVLVDTVLLNGLDVTAAITEVLGPDRDGHNAICGELTTSVRPLRFLLWRARFLENPDSRAWTTTSTKATGVDWCVDVFFKRGDVMRFHVDPDTFTMDDVVLLCTGRRPLTSRPLPQTTQVPRTEITTAEELEK